MRLLSVQGGNKSRLPCSHFFFPSILVYFKCVHEQQCKWSLWSVLSIKTVCIFVQLPTSLCEHMSTNMMLASYFWILTLPQEKDAKRGPSTVTLFQENPFYSSWKPTAVDEILNYAFQNIICPPCDVASGLTCPCCWCSPMEWMITDSIGRHSVISWGTLIFNPWKTRLSSLLNIHCHFFSLTFVLSV